MSAALVTGASSGIGRELARLFAADGHRLVLVARRRAALETLAAELADRHGVEPHVVAADLAAPDGPAGVAEAVERLGLEVDHLVNNAGFGLHGSFVATDPDAERAMIGVNVLAPTELAKRFLPEMVRRGRGRVLNVASTAAFQPGPGMAVYYATKAYVLSLSVALSVEAEGTGVTVTALCPGPTRTGFAEVAGVAGTRIFSDAMTMDACRVAAIGYRAMRRGDPIVVAGLGNRLLAATARLTSLRLAARIAGRLQASGAGP